MASRVRRPRRGCLRCCGCSVLVPLMLLGGLYALFVVRNRPPNLQIPTPPLPADNAYDDFVAAAKLIRAIPHKAPASMLEPPTTREAVLAQTAACTNEAEPGLTIIRAAFGKAC